MTDFQKKTRIVDEDLLERVRNSPCVVCGRWQYRAIDPHHIISRGSGGDDVPWNVAPLCRLHHQEFHSIGLTRFTARHLGFAMWLQDHGWNFDDHRGKWLHE